MGRVGPWSAAINSHRLVQSYRPRFVKQQASRLVQATSPQICYAGIQCPCLFLEMRQIWHQSCRMNPCQPVTECFSFSFFPAGYVPFRISWDKGVLGTPICRRKINSYQVRYVRTRRTHVNTIRIYLEKTAWTFRLSTCGICVRATLYCIAYIFSIRQVGSTLGAWSMTWCCPCAVRSSNICGKLSTNMPKGAEYL